MDPHGASNTYSRISITDAARAHLGDHFGNVNNVSHVTGNVVIRMQVSCQAQLDKEY